MSAKKLMLKTATGKIDTADITGVNLRQKKIGEHTFYDLEILTADEKHPLFGYTNTGRRLAKIYRDEVFRIMSLYSECKPCTVPMLFKHGFIEELTA